VIVSGAQERLIPTKEYVVRFTLADGTGKTSNLAVQYVDNSGVARNPLVAPLPSRTAVRGTVLTQGGSFTDTWGGSWSATVDYGDGTGVQPLTLTGQAFTLSHQYNAAPGAYTATVTVTSDIGGVTVVTMPVTVVAPVGVNSVMINDGSAQRSRVTSLTVTFGGLVTLPATAANAFSLVGPHGSIVLSVDTSLSTATQTIVRLTFGGPWIEFDSLEDGNYTLTVLGGQLADGYGAPIDGDGDGLAGGNGTTAFHRLFGDSDGDRDMDTLDMARFRRSFNGGAAAYLWWFDFDGDGDVDHADLARTRTRFGTFLPPP